MHYNFTPETDSSDNKTKHTISFSEKKLLRLIKEEGVFHENVWKLSHEIALQSLNLGVSFIKKNNYENGEIFFLKAKKLTEPPNPNVNWETRLDWQIIRFNIFQNLAIIYQNQKKDEKAYELLKSLMKHLKPENIITQNAEIMISSIDNLYINLANLCYTLQHHDECIFYSNLGIKFMSNALKNEDLMSKIEFLLKKNREDLSNFIASQKMFMAYLFHLMGKCELKNENSNSALINFQQAYAISKEMKGEKDEITMKYKKKIANAILWQENQRTENFADAMSESMNFSENHSPAGKKRKYIKNFVKNQEPLFFLHKDLNSPIKQAKNDDSKPKIPLNLISPKQKILKYEDSTRGNADFTKRHQESNQLFFKFDEIADNGKNMNKYMKDPSENKSKSNFPMNNLFLAISDLNPSEKFNTHTKSLTNCSEEIQSFLIRKTKNKKEFHRSNFSQQFPSLDNLLINDFNFNTNSSSSQRNLLYNVSNLSTRPSSKPENLTKHIELFHKTYKLPENEILNPPKKYQFLMIKRPHIHTASENPLTIQNIIETPSHIDSPLKLRQKPLNIMSKIPSITINSIGEFLEKTLPKNHRNLKTPKSSFSSINTPKVLKTASIRIEPKIKTEKGLFKSISLRRNITVKIPNKPSTTNTLNQRIIASSHNTPALSESHPKTKKTLLINSSSQLSINNPNNRKFSMQTPQIMPHHPQKLNKDDKKQSDINNKFQETESPIKLNKNETPAIHKETFLKRQKTVEESIINLNSEKNMRISGENQENSELMFENAAILIQRHYRNYINRRKFIQMATYLASIPQRKSAGNRLSGKESINLRSLKNSEANSNNTSKFSPRREEVVLSSKIVENEELSEEYMPQSSKCSLMDQSDFEDLHFFPVKFLLNVISRFSSWTFVNFGFSDFHKQRKTLKAKISLRSSLFNIDFTWLFPMESLNKPKTQGIGEFGAWRFLNLALEMKIRNENQLEFYLVEKDSLEKTGNLIYKQDSKANMNSNDFEEFISSLGKLKFFLKHFFILKRKIIGKIWSFSSDLQQNTQINFYSRELRLFLAEKNNNVQFIACKPNNQIKKTSNSRSPLKKMQSLDHLDPLERSLSKEYSLFSKISSPATSETNYQKNRIGLPPMNPQARPSISLSLYDNHIKLIKKAEMPENERDNDYRFQTLTQPPILLTQLKTALSNKEMPSNNNLNENNKSVTMSKKGSTVKEVSEDIVELSEDSEQRNNQEDDQKDSEKQSVMIKKDSISNEYISIENAIKDAGLMNRSESVSPTTPIRRVTYSPKHIRLDRKSYMKKCNTGIVGEGQFEEIMDNLLRSSTHLDDDKESESFNFNGPKLRLMNSFKRKQRFVRNELNLHSTIEEEQSPAKTKFMRNRKRKDFKFKWDFYKDLNPIRCPKDLFPEKENGKAFSEKFINCFEDREIFFQKIIKIQNNYFILLLLIGVDPLKERVLDFIKTIDLETIEKILKDFYINVELFQISSKFKVKYTMKMDFHEFNENFLEKAFCLPLEILKFFQYKKFNAKILKILLRNLKKISIENCNLKIIEEIQQKKLIKISPSPHIILPDSEENLMSNETLVLHDPMIAKMKFYDSIKILNKTSYYEKFHDGRETTIFRVKFLKNEDNEETAKISIYRPFAKRIEYQNIASQIIFEKLVTFMQISNKRTKNTLFKKLLMNSQPNFPGKNICISVSKREGLHFSDIPSHDLDFFYNFTQNIFSKRDHPIMYHYFTVKTFFKNFEIENMGRAYVKISMFKLKPLKRTQFIHNFTCFFLLEIYQNAATRYKLQKYVLTVNDICTYINFQFSEQNELNLLTELNKNVFKHFIYCKDKLYKSLQLPFNRFSQSNSKKFSLLKMDLNKFSIQKSGIRKFLRPELNEYRIIYQGIKKMFGLFTIVTIKKHHILKFWSLAFYFPKTNRDFSISLYNSDIFRMTSGFFEELFPISMKEIQEIFTKCNNKRITYHIFTMEYEKLMKKDKLFNAEDLPNPSKIIKKKISKANQTSFFSNSKFFMNFVEIKFWESIISQMRFSKTIKGKIMVNIDNFYTMALEHLFDQLVVLKNKDLIIFQVMNEHLYRKFQLEHSIEAFKYRESENFIIKLKIHELSSTKISNDTFCLQELLHLYICENKIKKKRHFDIKLENLKTFNINHAFLRFLCTFLYLKIRNIEKVITIGSFEKFENEFLAFKKSEESEEKTIDNKINKQILRLNCKLQVQSLYFNNHKKWLLIYKHFLTVRPRQMIAILYSQFHKKIRVYLYNNKNCKAYTKSFSVERMKVHIPYLNEMLILQEFNVIGYRILKALKNTLLVSSFFNLCL